MRLAILIMTSLASCRAPDTVGVGASANQFDMLGYSSSTFLEDQTGMGYGVGVFAEWTLSNQPQPITWEWPQSPPYYLTKDGTPPPTTIVVGSDQEPKQEGAVDKALSAGMTVNAWGPVMQIGLWLAILTVIVVLGKRLLEHWLTRKT
tara:strand:- start:1032 stop:1475 length:444 start_codon:yes stop_codon:yes gene_type:complete